MKFINDLKKHETSSQQAPSVIRTYKDLSLNLSSSYISSEVFNEFKLLTQSLNLFEKYSQLTNGNIVNYSENSQVLHHLTRNLSHDSFFSHEANRMYDFIDQLNLNKIPELDNIKTIVQIGVGGSFLGPKSIYEAFKSYFLLNNIKIKRTGYFISNLDPLEFHQTMASISPKETLFLIATKSGSTLETKSNYDLLKYWWTKEHGLHESQLKHHCISLCCKGVEFDTSDISTNRFYIDNSIGGRFSSTSVIGTCILSLCFGKAAVNEFLNGAKENDDNAANTIFDNNLALNAAWTSIWYRNIKKYSAKVIVSYSYALRGFPLHLQQLICESNGKSVNIDNQVIPYETSPVIISSTGTQCQHSFFQLIHQSHDIIPLEFINIQRATFSNDHYSNSFKQLNACLKGQVNALNNGQKNTQNPNKHFSGDRPSLSLELKKLTPFSVGQLLSFYENRTIFEGFIWNLNSFDQEGVQLGKQLTQELLDSYKPL